MSSYFFDQLSFFESQRYNPSLDQFKKDLQTRLFNCDPIRGIQHPTNGKYYLSDQEVKENPDGLSVHHRPDETRCYLIVEMGGHSGYTLVHQMARKGNVPCLQYLVEVTGARPELTCYSTPPLYLSAAYGHVGTTQFLLEQGVNPCCPNKYGYQNSRDLIEHYQGNQTPLGRVQELLGNPKVVQQVQLSGKYEDYKTIETLLQDYETKQKMKEFTLKEEKEMEEDQPS